MCGSPLFFLDDDGDSDGDNDGDGFLDGFLSFAPSRFSLSGEDRGPLQDVYSSFFSCTVKLSLPLR